MHRSRHHSSLRHRGSAAAALVVFGAASGIAALSPAVHAQTGTSSGTKKFCAAWLALDAIDTPGGPQPATADDYKAFAKRVTPVFTTAKANAVASLSGPMGVIDAAVRKSAAGDGSGIDDPKTLVAIDTIGKDARTRCGWLRIELTAKDYTFIGMPKTIKAGVVSFAMKNASATEMHVLLLFRRPAAVKSTPLEFAKETFAAFESGDPAKIGAISDRFIDGSGPFAVPQTTGYHAYDLKPGTCVFACPIPLQGKEGAAGHFMSGMVGELTVR